MASDLYIWLICSFFILFSWFRLAPLWLGWLAFFFCLTISFVQHWSYSIDLFSFDWLWLIGMILVFAGLFRFLHRAFIWVGLFITLIAAGMEWVASYDDLIWQRPYYLVNPSFDMWLYCMTVFMATTAWFYKTLPENSFLCNTHNCIIKLNEHQELLEKRDNPKSFERRSEIISDIQWSLVFLFFDRLGPFIAASSLVYTIFFLGIANNFYDTGATFNFILFSSNWFWALIIIGISCGFLSDFICARWYRIDLFNKYLRNKNGSE